MFIVMYNYFHKMVVSATTRATQQLSELHADLCLALLLATFLLDCGSIVLRHESVRLHTCHISIVRGC